MYYIVEIACVFTEMWMIRIYLDSLFDRRHVSRFLPPCLYLILGLGVSILSLIDRIEFIRLLFAVFSIFCISITLFQARIASGIFSGIAFCAIFALTDILSALTFQVFGIQIETLMTDNTYRSFYLVTCHIIMFGIILLVCQIRPKAHRDMSLRIMLPVLPCWVISLLLCLLLTWQCFVMHYELHPLFVFVLLGMLYTCMIVLLYTGFIYDQIQEQNSQEIAEHHYAMQQEYYDQFRVQQEETRALWHDISKYLQAAKTETSDNALIEVQEMLDSISCVVDVNNRIVSVILNEYVQSARSAGVLLEMDVQVPEVLFVTAADLYVLIGNTLDNAIEACMSLPEEQRTISLKLKTHNNILFYEVSNPYTDKHPHLSKNNYHGYGLKNVARCVEKYHGKMQASGNDGIFRVTAYLNSL